jgi:hypothetical protein
MVCPEGPIATRSGSSEGLVRALHGCQFPCGCDGVSCVVSAGGCTAVPAYGAENIVPGYGAWDMLSACLAWLRCIRIHSTSHRALRPAPRQSPFPPGLRPIDARDQNELPAISRDPNVIGAGCKASCAHRSLSYSGFRH